VAEEPLHRAKTARFFPFRLLYPRAPGHTEGTKTVKLGCGDP